MDYYYNLQGWIKGVNVPSDNASHDPGEDGLLSSNNKWIPKDEMSYHLGYFQGDYNPIGSNINLGMASLTADFNNEILTVNNSVPGLFNGNITSMITNIPGLVAPGVNNEAMNAMVYQYDALHRIKQAKTFAPNSTSNSWVYNGVYDSNYSYDPNGNIESLQRNYGSGNLIDNLTYNYTRMVNGIPDLEHNQLQQVEDNVTGQTHGDLIGQIDSDNYKYDEIGNLTSDESESIDEIEWTVYGKVKKVSYISTLKGDLTFDYDASGNRLTKITRDNSNNIVKKDFYVRDASGNIMGVYSVDVDPLNQTYSKQLQDVNLYGSSRIGNYSPPLSPQIFDPTSFSSSYPFLMAEFLPIFTSSDKSVASLRGNKSYELANHLGNVLVTVSDRKIGVDAIDPVNNDGIVDFYEAEVLSANDYYPFGWSMPGRQFAGSEKYRFGFNGKENDSEWGSQVIQDYGFRIYNPSIGKFLSVDPLTASFPWYTPYQFAGNKVISSIDLDGLEEVDYRYRILENGKTLVYVHRTPNTTSNSNDGVLLIHNRTDGGTYTRFEYEELNNYFLGTPNGQNGQAQIRRLYDGSKKANPLGSERYTFVLYDHGQDIPTSESAPNDYRDADVVFGGNNTGRLFEVSKRFKVGGGLGTRSLDVAGREKTDAESGLLNTQKVIYETTKNIMSQQELYNQNADQVQQININITSDSARFMDLDKIKNQLQATFENADVNLTTSEEVDMSNYTMDYEGSVYKQGKTD